MRLQELDDLDNINMTRKTLVDGLLRSS